MTGDTSIHEEMVFFIQQYPDGVSSSILAQQFLKFKNADEKIAHIAVSGILQTDRRCEYRDGCWFVIAESQSVAERKLEEEPWLAVYLLAGRGARARELMHFSAWTLFDTPSLVLSQWLVDAEQIPAEERDLLISPYDKMPSTSGDTIISEFAGLLENKTVLFFSSQQQGLWSRACLQAGESLLDDTMVLSYLCKVADVPVSRPMTLESICGQLFSRTGVMTSAFSQGEKFAECCWELLRRTKDKGLAGRADMEKWDARQNVEIDWKEKKFSFSDIQNAPLGPGVYGFTNRSGEFIYIGKAKNVRKRLLGYFRQSEESPEKLIKLRNEACGLTVHRCGSELESLLYEYRLIRKYAPKLNTQVDVNERKGTFNSVGDSVFLLPHADEGKGLAVCFRKDQKVSLLPFEQDFSDQNELVTYLDQFFFSGNLQCESTDFPEQEIVFRWVNKNRDHVVRIDVSRSAVAGELIENIKCYWPEVS